MKRARDSEKFEMPRFRDWADILRDASFYIDHFAPLSMDSLSDEEITTIKEVKKLVRIAGSTLRPGSQ